MCFWTENFKIWEDYFWTHFTVWILFREPSRSLFKHSARTTKMSKNWSIMRIEKRTYIGGTTSECTFESDEDQTGVHSKKEKSEGEHIGVHSYPIRFSFKECTPIWSLSCQGMHSHVVPFDFCALPCGPKQCLECTPILSSSLSPYRNHNLKFK